MPVGISDAMPDDIPGAMSDDISVGISGKISDAMKGGELMAATDAQGSSPLLSKGENLSQGAHLSKRAELPQAQTCRSPSPGALPASPLS
jgi:hypothetical protein